jgi:hypothetical protein
LSAETTAAAVENGVSLTALTDVAEDAAYLAQAVAAQLDNDWIPQVKPQSLRMCGCMRDVCHRGGELDTTSLL